MSLLLLEGFDDGLLSQRWSSSGVIIQSSAYNRLGNVAHLNSNGDYFRYILQPADEDDTLTVGFHVNFQANQTKDTSVPHLQFYSDGWTTSHVSLRLLISGALRVQRGTTVLLGDSRPIFIAPNLPKYVEMQAKLHDTTGFVKVWVDGVLEIDLTGIDTKNGGTKTVFDGIRFGNNQSGSPNPEYDDIYITNTAGSAPYNGLLGNIVVAELFPNGNGATSEFVGSDGNSVDNHLLVDEAVPDDDTTYVESTTDGDRDSYEFTDLPYATGVIRGVIVTTVARNPGAADNLQITTRIAAADYDGPTLAVPLSYDAATRRIMQVSPATAGDWTIAEVNDAEFGFENVV